MYISQYQTLDHYCYLRALKRLYTPNDELVNAWTMIFGSCISCIMLYNVGVGAPFTLILVTASAIVHLPWSVGYHIFNSVSPQCATQWRTMDIIFIFVSGFMLCVSLGYYAFPLHTYINVVSTCFVVCVVGITKTIDNRSNANLGHIILPYIALLCACYVSPMILYCTVYSHGKSECSVHCIAVIASLVLGAYVFAKELPQKLYPGKFNLIGNSHNIMHICIIIAHINEFQFVKKLAFKQI